MFPPAVATHLHALFSACMRGVMLPLGDRVRPPPYAPPRPSLPERLVVVVQHWLMKRKAMIAILMERIAAGKHRPRACKPREIRPDAARKPRPDVPPEKRLPPRVFGWIRLMAPEMGGSAEGLSRLLAEAEMQAMVLAAPQMARLWVPLLNAMGEARPAWWPKPPPRPIRKRAARPPQSRAQAPSIDGPDPATAPLPQMGTWFPPQPPPSPPRRITSWRDFVDSMRPLSQNFEPPPSDWVVVPRAPGKPGF